MPREGDRGGSEVPVRPWERGRRGPAEAVLPGEAMPVPCGQGEYRSPTLPVLPRRERGSGGSEAQRYLCCR